MESNIKKQFELIEESINWISDSLNGEKQSKAYSNLINLRRKLKSKNNAFEENPAVAIYGASQMGKSYLTSNLLAEQGKPFQIIDGHNKTYEFINQINPIGHGTEATSLVTRFSTKYKWINPNFPVKAKILTPADIVKVLCDSFYNDIKIKADSIQKSEAINLNIEVLVSKYKNDSIQQDLITEDEILDIKDYFNSFFSNRASSVIHSNFFEKVSTIISYIKIENWSNIFEILWNNNNKFTSLFNQLISELKKLEFSNSIYLPINAVLREYGTLLDVSRLSEFIPNEQQIKENFEKDTSILLVINGNQKTIDAFSKSSLCALAAELVFMLPQETEANKPFLKETDLLDFPGARNRLGRSEDNILDDDIPKMLLRGKVAYLFNYYSISEKINILLFCQNNEKSELQDLLPELLASWIEKMIGKDKTERSSFISSSKIPPLFIVSTMFNKDLQFNFNNDTIDDNNFRNSRWERRFITVFNEIFGSKKWLNEWTLEEANFQNIFLLRDYFYSSDTENKIYKGYNENKIEVEEIIPEAYPNFRNDLKKSFLENDFVIRHFTNPKEAWDRAANMNEDGANYIIEKLSFAASNINKANITKNIKELNSISTNLSTELNKYYHSSDSDILLQKAKITAGGIQIKLDIAFGKDPYFFGHMINAMMINENIVYNLYLEKIRDIERREVINMDKYSAIRMMVPDLNANNNFETNLTRLRLHYEQFSNEACKEYFEAEGIDLNELFFGNKERVRNFSNVLADELESYWFNQFMPENKQLLNNFLSESNINEIQDMLRKLYSKLGISNVVAEKIRTYVDGYRNIEDTYEMISDISAEIINKFINSIGLEFMNEEIIRDLKNANIKNKLGLNIDHDELVFINNNPSEAADIISKMGNLPALLNQNPLPLDAIKSLPNFRNYKLWYDLLKVGFVSVCDIPNYDVEANFKLKELIDKNTAIQF